MVSIETSNPTEDAKAIALRDEAVTLASQAESLIVSANTLEFTAQLAGSLTSAKKRLEEQRQFLVGPLNNHVTKINNLFKLWTAPIEAARRVIDEKVVEYKREEARAAAEVASFFGDDPAMADPGVKTIRSSAGTLTVKEVWDFEVLDAALIPESFKTVNEKAIRAAVKAGVREIPGVRVFQTEQVAVRAQ